MNHDNLDITSNSITFLNETGDVTITWDDESEAEVKALVAKKLKEGYTFFTVKRRMLVLSTKSKLGISDVVSAKSIKMDDDAYAQMKKSLSEEELSLLKNNSLLQATGDADVSVLVAAQKAALALLSDKDETKPLARTKDINTIVSNQCVAFRATVGG